MPANKKYLTVSVGQRIGKISAGILGGYAVTIALHMALASWTSYSVVMITMTFSVFILWVILMIVAFLSHTAWRIWLLYSALAAVFIAIAFLGKSFNPHFMH